MKKLLVIIDGMDDEPNPILGGLTPSRYANMPALNHMRKNGCVSMKNTIPAGNQPGTEVAVLNILGYDVPEGFSSRSWLEALGSGINISESDFCLRCNLISHSDGLITSHCGAGVNRRQCDEITGILNNHFGSDNIRFYGNGDFRNLMIVHDAHSEVEVEAPHTLIGKPISRLLVTSDNKTLENALNRCIVESRELLKSYPANGISLWAPGRSVCISGPRINGTLISGVNVMKGIGRAIGMAVPNVEGATGDEHTNYRAKLDAAISILSQNDFVLLHIEAPDEVSHSRDVMKKVRILEDIDRELLSPLLNVNIDLEITVQSDHATSSLTGLHLDTPVEVVVYTINSNEK